MDRLWQFVPTDKKGAVRDLRFPPLSMEDLDSTANLITDADEFLMRAT